LAHIEGAENIGVSSHILDSTCADWMTRRPVFFAAGRLYVLEGIEAARDQFIEADPLLDLTPIPASVPQLTTGADIPFPDPVSRERPDPADVRLTGFGPHFQAVLTMIRGHRELDPPDPELVTLLHLPLPDDLRAYIFVCAHHDVRYLDIGDLTTAFGVYLSHDASAKGAFVIGTSGFGDTFIAEVVGSEVSVRCVEHDGDGEQWYGDLEGLFAALVEQAKQKGEGTVIDDLI
jgi:hypothetical protein